MQFEVFKKEFKQYLQEKRFVGGTVNAYPTAIILVAKYLGMTELDFTHIELIEKTINALKDKKGSIYKDFLLSLKKKGQESYLKKYFISSSLSEFKSFVYMKLKGKIISSKKLTENNVVQTIFFGAPGTGKSFKVNSILGEERKKCFAESSEIAKSNHYADVLSNEEYIDCNIWIIDNIGTLEKKLAEFDLDDKRANPRHSALQAYIDFLKKYREENRELRTTFHPDYDYAQFVGAYKPKKVRQADSELLSEEQLAQKLSEFFPNYCEEENTKTMALALFGLQYFNSLKDKTMSKIVRLSGIGGSKYISATLSAVVKTRAQQPDIENDITYSFVPQVFAKAYAAAWRLYLKGDDVNAQVFLIIEEINRGNCAQIFGDIFQLLDRDSEGFSQYSIDADCDFAEWLEKEFTAANLWDAYKKKVGGEGKLKLPPNLNILATMNTSDQSLFPMDSAFKRRFDWEYVPINYSHKDADFTVGDDAFNFKWLAFLKKVNADIYKATESEDKQMGEFFIKPKNGSNEIGLDEFRSKVLFYLWDSVYKDDPSFKNIFHFNYPEKDGSVVTFQRLFAGDFVEILKQMLKNLDEAYKEGAQILGNP